MALRKSERTLIEAIKNAMDADALGLHKFEPNKEVSHTQQFKYEDIRDMMLLKINHLAFSTEIMGAFQKNHSYKYVTDESFFEGFTKDMKARGIPLKQQNVALKAVNAVVKDLDHGREEDYGWNKDMEGLKDVTTNADSRKSERSVPFNNKENLRAVEIDADYDEIK